MTPSTSRRTRRALLLGGASAVVGAGLVTAEAPAEAAGPPPLLVGRGNNAGRSATSLTTSAAKTAWAVVQRGAGLGVTVSSAATALLAAAGLGSAWGLHGRNTASRTGTGGAVRAEGRHNAGLFADTTAQNVPAVVAIGGDGTGVAQVATGQSYLDGDALALRAWTGVAAPGGTRVAYAPVVSAEAAFHTAAGNAALDAQGAAAVALPATFTAACDMTMLSVTLTPVAAAMPGLYVTYRPAAGSVAGVYDGFTVAGGAASGTVAWAACATRGTVDLERGPAAAAAPAPSAASPGTSTDTSPGADAPGVAPQQARVTRVTRRSLRLPAR